MSNYSITAKTSYTNAWIPMLVLMGIAVGAWYFLSPIIAMVFALIGVIIAAIGWRRGKKQIGNNIELSDESIIFYDKVEARCIAFKDIKTIKINESYFSRPKFKIVTTINEIDLQPDDYENCEALREQLLIAFEKNGCEITN